MKLTHPNTEQSIDVAPGHVDRYLEQGWRPATVEAPAGNASLADWQDFARTQGFAEDDIEGKTRAELRAALS
jgi:hypothetical protein